MRRREFITLLGSAAATWPLAARAQQPAMPVVGFLSLGSPSAAVLAPFRQGLSEQGFTEGRNVMIDYRFAHNAADQLPGFVAELARRPVAVIVSTGLQAIIAAKAATTTIPIVFITGGDPVELGAVASLNRPGGNVTGVTTIATELGAKQLGLLSELLPNAKRFAVLVNPINPALREAFIADVRAAAATLRRDVEFFSAGSIREIDSAFAALSQTRPDGLLVNSNGLFNDRQVQLVTLAAHYRVPAIYSLRANAEVGGLMTYGPSQTEGSRQAGLYAGRTLKGEKPADLPVTRPTKFEFVINMQTARTLGLDVPATLLARADEVIE